MRKTLSFYFFIVLFFCGSAIAKEQTGYLFFQTAGDWKYGSVYIDDVYKGRISNGYALIALSPGEHTLTMFKRSSGYNNGYTYTKPNINFKVEEDRLTSIGVIAILDNGYGKNISFFLKDDETALKYVKLNYAKLYSTISSSPVLRPTLRYQNNILTDIRKLFFKERYKEANNSERFFASELGLLADMSSGEPVILDTGVLDQLWQLRHQSVQSKPVFMSPLSEFYVLDGGFKKIPTDVNNIPSFGAQVNEWLFAVGHTGDLSRSNDLGETWHKTETKISKNKYVKTMSAITEKEFIFGPITSSDYDNEYDKLVGYVVDTSSAEMKEIAWSKYVTANSVFQRVNNTLYMDPVTLGNKAFLFVYVSEKNKWKEVRLPNRHCKINLSNTVITLNCTKGSNFTSVDGSDWQEIKK